MKTNIFVRVLELLVYLGFSCINALLFDLESAAAVLNLMLCCLLMFTNINKYIKYEVGTEERDTQKRIALLSLIHNALMIFAHVIYLIFWATEGISLKGVKICTWFWYVITFASLLVLLIQLFYRLFTMMREPEYVALLKNHDMNQADVLQRTYTEDVGNPWKVEANEEKAAIKTKTIIGKQYNDGHESMVPVNNSNAKGFSSGRR